MTNYIVFNFVDHQLGYCVGHFSSTENAINAVREYSGEDLLHMDSTFVTAEDLDKKLDKSQGTAFINLKPDDFDGFVIFKSELDRINLKED